MSHSPPPFIVMITAQSPCSLSMYKVPIFLGSRQATKRLEPGHTLLFPQRPENLTHLLPQPQAPPIPHTSNLHASLLDDRRKAHHILFIIEILTNTNSL